MAVFEGDVGVRFELEFRDYDMVDGVEVDKAALDISAAGEISLFTERPDGTPGALKTLGAGQVRLLTDGTDGKAYYDTEEGFLDQAGTWKLQALVELSGGGKHHSKVVSFRVEKALQAPAS